MRLTPLSLVVILICLAYAAFRVWGLIESCLWFDEIFGVHAAELSVPVLLDLVSKDLIHPPLFYLLLKLWITIGNDSLLWLRLFPFVFSLLALAPFLLICREIRMGSSATVAALVLFTVNGSLIKYAQEVRMYSLLLCLSLISIWLFTRFFYKGKNFLLLLIVNILLVHTHYFGWLVIGAEVLAIAWFQRIKLARVLASTGITAVAFVPWFITVISAARSGSEIGQNIGWIERPGILAAFEFAVAIVEPFHYRLSSTDPITIPYVSLPILAAVGIAKLGYFLKEKSEAEKIRLNLLAIFCGVPVAVAFLASWVLPFSVWGNRHLIIVLGPMLLLAGVFLAETTPRILQIILVAVCAIAIVTGLYYKTNTPQPNFIWCAWEEFVAGDELSPKPSDEKTRILVFEDLVAYHFWFATRKRDDVEIALVKGIPGVDEDSAYFLPRGFSGVSVISPNDINDNSVLAAFRAKPPQIDLFLVDGSNSVPPPVNNFRSLGYRVTEQRSIKKDGAIAYVIRLEATSKPPK